MCFPFSFVVLVLIGECGWLTSPNICPFYCLSSGREGVVLEGFGCGGANLSLLFVFFSGGGEGSGRFRLR